MEIVLRSNENELCIDHQEGSVGFTVLTDDDKQLNFNVELDDWEHLKNFIDGSIENYRQQ